MSHQPIATLLTPKEAADSLRVTERTLTIWRHTKRYPLAYVKIGRSVRYRVTDIEAFKEARVIQ